MTLFYNSLVKVWGKRPCDVLSKKSHPESNSDKDYLSHDLDPILIDHALQVQHKFLPMYFLSNYMTDQSLLIELACLKNEYVKSKLI